jgi:signal-transduction protein with cAMP-binding, CBS, and nucleotidyltransferase domain
MSMRLGDLDLEDEHVTVGLEDSLMEAAHRLIDVPGGVLIVLDDEGSPHGIVRPDHVLMHVVRNSDLTSTRCRDVMESDLLRMSLMTPLGEVIAAVEARSPAAVVAVDENGEYAGWFSPSDLARARERLGLLRELDRARR